ncbi:hypothetical protein SCLCIDRAFT_34344, partial [Scleroderma citrinum Foug A]
NLFPNCSEKKLRNKIGIPEPPHPTEDDTNQLPPDDLDLPPQDPPQQPDDGLNDEDGNESDSTQPQSPHQQNPKPEEVDDNDTQNPLREPHFNIGRTPTPPRPYSPPPHNMPGERHFRINPPRIRIPPVRPGNIYGHRHPVDIEREIEHEREWTRQVLEGNAPIVPEAVPEQDEPMGSPLTPLPPTPPPGTEEPIELRLPGMDIDQMMQLGHHYILNQIMKQAAKLKEGIPYHYKDILKYNQEEQEKWKRACEEEIKSITDRNIWTLVDCPPDRATGTLGRL